MSNGRQQRRHSRTVGARPRREPALLAATPGPARGDDGLRACEMVERAPAAMCVIGADDLRVLYANAACAQLLEMEPEEVRGKPLPDLLPPGCEKLLELLLPGRDSCTSATLDNLRWAHEGARERVWTVHVVPRVEPGSDRATELMLFIADVSERAELVRAADRIARNEHDRLEQLDAIFASIPSAVVLVDDAGRMLKCNRAAETLFNLGITPGLTIGSPEFALSRPDGADIPIGETPLARALRGEIIQGEEVALIRKGRLQRRLSVTAAPVIADGRVTAAVAVLHDISEIRDAEDRMERALQAERQRAREARTLYDAARVISSDLKLQECLHILAETAAEAVGVSRCFVVLLEGEATKGVTAFGMSQEHVAGLQNEFFPQRVSCPRSLRVIREARPSYVADVSLDPLIDQRQARALDMRSVLIAPLVYGNRVTGLAYVYEPDVERGFSDSDRATAMAIAAQGAVAIENARLYEIEQDRARMLEFMMAELNHRVKNNLAIVCGLLSLQLTESDPRATKESVLRGCITRIQSISLIHQMLHEEDVDAVEMKETTRRIAAMICDTFATAQQRITCRVRGDRLMLPCSHATSLGVAMNELICNAVKHGLAGHEQGEVVITFTVRDQVRITVSDNGRGLASGFDLAREGHVGTLVVTGIVGTELGGSFALESNARGGATARVIFPAAAVSTRA